MFDPVRQGSTEHKMESEEPSSYLSKFLQMIESLPAEVRRTFALLEELDRRQGERREEWVRRAQGLIDRTCQEDGEERAGDERRKRAKVDEGELEALRQQYRQACAVGEEMVMLTQQTYEMVDSHIVRLDRAMELFSEELEHRQEKKRSASGQARGLERDGRVAGSAAALAAASAARSAASARQAAPAPAPSPPPVPREVLDMPVNPNEPTYCFCRRVFFGDMVGCDNPNCPIEWFHFGCVGLTAAPTGTWICPECTQKN